MRLAARGTSFEELNEYYLLNGGSHLKPPARIGAPALTWHTALWIPALGADVSFEVRRENWLQNVDWFLASFARRMYEVWKCDRPADAAEAERLRPHAFNEVTYLHDARSQVTLFRHRVELGPNAQGDVVRFDRLDASEIDQYRNEVVSFKFFFHGIPMKLRASLHNEIVALTFIAELHFGHALEWDRAIPDKLRYHFGHIAEELKARVEVLSKNSRNALHDSDTEPRENFKLKNALAASSSYLYNGFWRDVWDAYGSCLWPAFDIEIHRKKDDGTPAPHIKRLRNKCANLSPALGLTFGDFRGIMLAGEMTKTKFKRNLSWEIDHPFSDHAKAESGIPLRDLTDRETIVLADALVPLLEAAEPQVADAVPAALTMGTSVRVAPGEAGSFRMGHEHTAARFLSGRALYLSSLAAHQRWQGSDDAHEPLRFLLVVPRKNRWQLGRLIERLHLLGTMRLASLKDLISLNAAGEELRTFGLTLDKVEKGEDPDPDLNARLSKINAHCSDGVLYRVERSRYYTSTFLKLTKLLRIVRIEGYQPYDEFVYRRLGSTWDSIDRLGNRMERARRRVDSINSSLQVREQTKLLEFAELAAVVPIGYYGGQILFSLISMAASLRGVVIPGNEHRYLGASGILVMLMYFFVVLPALKKSRKRRDALLMHGPAATGTSART